MPLWLFRRYFERSASGEVVRQQAGVLRTNCVDCLDRTNVTQVRLAVEAAGERCRKSADLDKPTAAMACHSKRTAWTGCQPRHAALLWTLQPREPMSVGMPMTFSTKGPFAFEMCAPPCGDTLALVIICLIIVTIRTAPVQDCQLMAVCPALPWAPQSTVAREVLQQQLRDARLIKAGETVASFPDLDRQLKGCEWREGGGRGGTKRG